MATTPENVQIPNRQEAKGETVQSSPDQVVREKLTNVLGDILTKAQEVGFELATLDCPKANECPLVRKSKELIVVLKKLFELRRELEKLQPQK